MRFSLLLTLLYLSLTAHAYAQSKTKKPYLDKSLPISARVDDLFNRLTLEEKVGQTLCVWNAKRKFIKDGVLDAKAAAPFLKNGIGQVARPNEKEGINGYSPRQTVKLGNEIQRYLINKTRLGIPAIFHEESLHGNQAVGATNFPTPLALACSFNPELMREIYTSVALEVRARGGHQVLAPVVDIGRDPRWGRIEETMGEDPYLTKTLATAIVKAYQGQGSQHLDNAHVISTLKHFPVHGTPEGGVNIAPAFVDERTVREVNFPAFEACVKEAGALSVMPCYNELNGIPAHANGRYINGVLRKEWGFKGIVVSDYKAIYEMMTIHKIVSDTAGAAQKALLSGIDVELPDMDCYPKLVGLARQNPAIMVALDSSVKRILKMKFMLGLFENPYADEEKAEQVIGSKTHRQIALKAAHESIVLLKNNGILPLDRNKKIALIGPNANRCILGGYSSLPKQVITPRQAFSASLASNLLFSEGVRITDNGDWFTDPVIQSSSSSNIVRIQDAIKTARQADVILLCLGGNEAISREAWAPGHLGDISNLELMGDQLALIDSLKKLNKPMVMAIFSGPPLALTRIRDKADALLQCFYQGQETGQALFDVVMGNVNPSGKLSVSMPRSVGHLPCYYSYKPSSRRGYVFDSIQPLYPFGYGLSYTRFKMTAPTLTKPVMRRADTIFVNTTITNTGTRAGAEVVQLYIRDDVSSVTRPIKELKGFRKVFLDPGQSSTIRIPITENELSFYNEELQRVVEPGTFTLMVGNSSQDTQNIQLRFE